MTNHPLKIVLVGFATLVLSQSSWQPFNPATWQLGIPSLASERSAKVRYKPPRRPGPKRTNGTGSRGCQGKLATEMMPLVPDGHIGTTTAGHPTFFWYMPTATPVRFALVEPGVPKPIVNQLVEIPTAGIAQFKLPDNKPDLQSGKEYRWSLTMVCPNLNRSSAPPYVQSWIARISPDPALAQQLAALPKGQPATETLRQQAQIYAQAGLWFDALTAISAAHTTNMKDLSLLEERFSLLEQVNLTQVIQQERQRLAQQQSPEQ